MQAIHIKKRAKNRYFFIAAIVIIIFINPFNLFGFVHSGFSVIFAPVSIFAQNVGTFAHSSFGMVFHVGDLHADNQRLTQEMRQLVAQNAMLGDLENENAQLRNELDLLPREKFDLVGAEVVLRDAIGGDQWIMINKGSHDGIAKDMAVIIDEGIFVGYIDNVDASSSRVRLLTHPESVVNVVDVENNAEAIARGHHGLSLLVEDIEKDDRVENGDMFVTSQIGNRFPRGLSVGTAQNVQLSDDQLFQGAHIMPLAPLGDVRFVFVIKN